MRCPKLCAQPDRKPHRLPSGPACRAGRRAWLWVSAAVLFTLLALAAGAHPARAAAYNYASGKELETINVGMLVLDSVQATAPAPGDYPGWYAFYILNQRPDIRPANWQIANPLAPKVVTQDIINRYNQASDYSVGQAITPNMAPYWEVNITRVDLTALSQFNLLVIHTHYLVDLTHTERELLRQYIDQGGTLWVDDCGTNGTYTAANTSTAYNGCATGNGFLFDAQFWNGVGGNGTAIVPNPTQRHPIILTPFFLSTDDLNALGDKSIGNYFITAGRGQSNTGSPGSMTAPEPALFTTVVGNSADSNMPSLSAGDYGSGHVLLSAPDIFDAISNPVENNGTPGYSTTNQFSAAPTNNLELLVNVISWATSTAGTDSVNDRRTGAQTSTINGSMSKEWIYPPSIENPNFNMANPFTGGSSSAAIFGNIAYVSDNAGYLHAFDIDPPESLTGSLNPDDGGTGTDPFTGLQFTNDLNDGTSYDELWVVNPTGGTGGLPLSAPTVAMLPGTGMCVFVEGDDGTVYAYPVGTATPTLAAKFKDNTDTSGDSYSAAGLVPPAPTVYDARLIAGQANSNVEITDLSNTTAPDYGVTFHVTSTPLNTLAQDSTPVIAPPAVASIPSNDGLYGGGDVVAYITTKEFVEALLLGSRDETLQPNTSGSGTYQTKPGLATSPLFQFQGDLQIFAPPEDPLYSPGVYENAPTFAEPQFINPNYSAPGFGLSPTSSDGFGPPFYADYDITATSTGGSSSLALTRTQISEAITGQPNTAANAVASGGAAVGPDNSIYITVNEPSLNSAYIEAVSEQNPNLGGPRNVIRWRFALASGITDASGIAYSFGGYQFVGPPVVDGGMVYALAQNGAGGSPIVLAFLADAVCGVHAQAVSSQQSTAITVTQVDESNQQNQLSPFQFHYSPGSGLITLTNFSGSLQSSPSLISNAAAPYPLQVTMPTSGGSTNPTGNSSLPMDTTLSGGQPLLQWWTSPLSSATGVVLGPLRKIGNYLYFAANFTNSATTPSQNESEIVAVDAELGVQPNDTTNDRQIVASSLPASEQQTFVQQFALAVGTSANPVTALPGLAATGNFAVIQGPSGIEGFGYHPTLVADSGRLIELAPGGNAIWAVDSTNQQQVQGGNLEEEGQSSPTSDQTGQILSSRVSLSHPSSISQVGQDDYLVADTGNNRVVRLDAAGNVVWELTSFNDPNGVIVPAPQGSNPPTFQGIPSAGSTPQGSPQLSLNAPSGATMWETVDTTSSPGNQLVYFHYLIADSGNNRVIEIDDKYTNGAIANAATDYHYVAWVSHTFDQAGRRYRYISAQLLTVPTANGTSYYVLGGVANANVAPMVTSGGTVQLAPANQDGPGSSLLLLNYGQTSTAGAFTYGNGLLAAVIDRLANDNNTTTGYVFAPMRGLHSAMAYVPANSNSGGSLWQIVIAEDDGVFSGSVAIVPPSTGSPITALTPLTAAALPYAGGLALDYTYVPGSTATGFSLTLTTTNGVANSADAFAGYQGVVDQYNTNVAATLPTGQTSVAYLNTPFDPASAVRLPSGNYLIVNRAVMGNPQNINSGTSSGEADFGGNVFELSPVTPVTAAGAGAAVEDLQGNILGRPGNSSALTGPAFAIRPL